MNSLTELNTYANVGLAYQDDRSFQIGFDTASPATQTVVQSEGRGLRNPVAANIVATRGVANLTISYTIDVSSVTGANVAWPIPLPTGITTSTPATGVYRISNITTPRQWETISSPMIYAPSTRTADWSYTSNIAFPSYGAYGSHLNWTTNVTITELNQPGAAYYDEDTVTAITPVMTFANVMNNSGLTYTANVRPYPITNAGDNNATVTSMTSSGTGGTSTFYNTPSVLTITGTKAQVTSHLANISITPHPDRSTDFALDYILTSPVRAATTVRQAVVIRNVNTESINLGIDRYYTQNTVALLFGATAPQIYETVAGNPTYTIAVQIPGATSRGIIGLGESYTNPVGWDGTTYTYSGTKDQCNTILQQLLFMPNKDVDGTYSLVYRQYRDGYQQTADFINLIGQGFTGNIAGQTTYTFTASSEFTPTFAQAHYLKANVLIIGGGGAGGSGGVSGSGIYGGGGGAGGYQNLTNWTGFSSASYAGTTYNMVVAGGGGTKDSIGDGNDGGPSLIRDPYTTLVSVAGGGGGGGYNNGGRSGRSGGSGGGASGNKYSNETNTTLGGNAIAGLGNAGGASNLTYTGTNAGGGGGAGSAGAVNRVGGSGVYNTITGANVQYAAGGYSGVTTAGSGASGGSPGSFGSAGQNGIIVVKFYT